ncbi:MAG: tRNA preQ1(34) S-adenosylmethionine ribosyltransferase-isomerase QueA [Desulfobacteraceae bacterium]|nr:tRNA preQ1(34) S-adenosylmethionine ribosyltransferase-isomerase QueA [Desulfobacteraceae bacterium]
MFSLEDYDYHLPENLIAHYPRADRDHSRLLFLRRNTTRMTHHRFFELENLLHADDVLVVNNTAVVPGRLFGKKETGGNVEVLILNFGQAVKNQEDSNHLTCECLINASKRPKDGSRIDFSTDLFATVLGFSRGIFLVRFTARKPFSDILKDIGHVPLPPYIKRSSRQEGLFDDSTSYQTVYASNDGAIAAPTAGLHFTEDLLGKLKAKGVKIVEITLHVGYGTFVPVRESDIRKHRMHGEWFSISEKSAEVLNTAKANGTRIVAVGTTSIRTLEYAANEHGILSGGSGNCDLYIYPGYRFKFVDAVITNFHLPKSTLLMLVSAFTGRENMLSAYEEAIANQYRFYSYGDAMLIE